MNPPIAQARAATTFHIDSFVVRHPLIVTVHGYDYGAEARYTATIQYLEVRELNAPDLATGSGKTPAEAVGNAMLDFATQPPNPHTAPYILCPNRPDEPKFDIQWEDP